VGVQKDALQEVKTKSHKHQDNVGCGYENQYMQIAIQARIAI
jgi:hypothetical protein